MESSLCWFTLSSTCILDSDDHNFCLCSFTTAITSRLDFWTSFTTSRIFLCWVKYSSITFFFLYIYGHIVKDMD
jgi:hypothetical protein